MIKLEQNYRSTSSILNAANALIRKNQGRYDKQLWSSGDPGPAVTLFHAPTESNEARAVAYRLAKLKEREGLKWSDLAILYRSNALSRSFEQELMKYSWMNNGRYERGIPFKIYGGLGFYERREIRDLVSYLRFFVNPSDQQALLRVINVPRRGIGDGTLDRLTQENRRTQRPLWDVIKNASLGEGAITPRARKGLCDLVSIVEEGREQFAKEPLNMAMDWLVQRLNYVQVIHEDVKSEKMRQFKQDNVQELVNSMAEYAESGSNKTLADFVRDTPLGQGPESKKDKDQGDHVSLMTFHSSKGLEFTACFLVGVEKDIVPHERSLKETGMEEERRLFYVGMTRAKKFLTISMARKRNRMGKVVLTKPSPFLYEIPKEHFRMSQWEGEP